MKETHGKRKKHLGINKARKTNTSKQTKNLLSFIPVLSVHFVTLFCSATACLAILEFSLPMQVLRFAEVWPVALPWIDVHCICMDMLSAPCQDPPFPGHLEVVNGWMWKSIWNHDACRYFATSPIKILFWTYCRELAVPRLLDFLLYAEAHRILSRSRKPPSGTTSALKDGNNWIGQLITKNTSNIIYICIYIFVFSEMVYWCGCMPMAYVEFQRTLLHVDIYWC